MTLTSNLPPVEFTNEQYTKFENILLDENEQLAKRFRALFSLKATKSDRAVEIISKCFKDSSCLLKHELAYVLGQMKNKSAIPVLFNVLGNLEENAMVRHEAGEAIGAIGDISTLPELEKYQDDMFQVVRETVELAINNIQCDLSNYQNEYPTTDPAPALESNDIKELESILHDTSLPLFYRYRAMFSLRNMNTPEAVAILAKGFYDNSALFRHEIAYIFGQMCHLDSVEPLKQVLENTSELSMVRHEAAEALGSIATQECFDCLQKYKEDRDRTVRESCIVGLDMYEYENSGQFNFIQ
ncbi:hypothetical protein HDV04_004829 [Boothiomyces sp. JEL0838]|nr:hypothetical protein HDV04_004829 [Boothiomyces sp. JEL0838]